MQGFPRSNLNTQMEVQASVVAAGSDLPPAIILPEEDDSSPLVEYWLSVYHHLGKILLFSAVAVTATALYVRRVPRLYESVAIVRVDPSSESNTLANPDGSNGADLSGLMGTEVAEAADPAVIIPTILQLHLENEPQFQAVGKGFGETENTVPDALIQAVGGGIQVERLDGTYLIAIHYRSGSPQLSARIANALARNLIEHEYDTRAAALMNASQYLSRQLDQLRARMERSQMELNAFERANNIVNPADRSTLMNQRLVFLANEMDEEQQRQRQVASDLELARQGTLNDLLVSNRGQSLAASMASLQAAQIRLAQLSAKYGSGDYYYRQAQREVERLQQAAEEQKSNVVRQIDAQNQALLMQIRLTRAAFEQEKLDLDAFNNRTVEYNILSREAATDKSLYDDLLRRINSDDLAAGFRSEAMRIVGKARADPVPVYPRMRLDLMLALVGALSLGVAVAIGVDHLNSGITSPEVVRNYLHASFIGGLPDTREQTALQQLMQPISGIGGRRSPFAEALHAVASALLLSHSGPLHSVCVTSCMANEGKTTLVSNLACALALQGRRVLLMDADLRRPSVHRIFDVPNRIGLANLLRGEDLLKEAVIDGPVPGLKLLLAGPAVADPASLTHSCFARILEELKSQYDIVLVDLPPLLGLADALGIAPVVDATLLIVRAGATSRALVRTALLQLQQVRASIGGVVLNRVTSGMSPHYYYYREYDRSSHDENRRAEVWMRRWWHERPGRGGATQ